MKLNDCKPFLKIKFQSFQMSELLEDNPPEVLEEAEEPVFEKEQPQAQQAPEEKPKEDRPPSPGMYL